MGSDEPDTSDTTATNNTLQRSGRHERQPPPGDGKAARREKPGTFEGMRNEVENRIKDLRQTMNGDDLNAIRSQAEELQKAATRLTPVSEPAGPQGPGGSSPNPHGNPDVVEGEYHEA